MLSLNMGINGALGGGQGTFLPGYGPAAVPEAAGATPQGPPTIGRKAFGIVAGDGSGGPATPGLGTTAIAVGSLAALVFIWWSLPR